YLGVQYRTAYVLLHKMREAIMLSTEIKQLSGNVQIDGGHFSGKKRKPRKVADKELPKLPRKYQHRDKLGPAENPFHKNRRIIMVFRECDARPPGKGGKIGAIRTITAICNAEDSQVIPLIERYVKEDSKIFTDELPAYRQLKYMGFTHETVNHSREFSTDEGVNQNQAESYFSRLRRAFIGVFHRITPRYMLDYSCEMSWREDMRRTDLFGQVTDLFSRVTSTPHSKDWRNYVRGNRRKDEIRTIPVFDQPTAI
ncbi:IS1595 family transposase, partial [Klebsiella aerogenes]